MCFLNIIGYGAKIVNKVFRSRIKVSEKFNILADIIERALGI